MPCRWNLGKVHERKAEFAARGARVAGVSGDFVKSLRRLRERKGWDLDLYHAGVDPLRTLGLLKAEKGLHGTPLAIPAAAIVDAAGIVRWMHARDALFARTGPDKLLRAIDGARSHPVAPPTQPPTP